jgi:hypothetical protein
MSAHYVEHNGIIAMLQPASVLCTNANSRTMTLTLGRREATPRQPLEMPSAVSPTQVAHRHPHWWWLFCPHLYTRFSGSVCFWSFDELSVDGTPRDRIYPICTSINEVPSCRLVGSIGLGRFWRLRTTTCCTTPRLTAIFFYDFYAF